VYKIDLIFIFLILRAIIWYLPMIPKWFLSLLMLGTYQLLHMSIMHDTAYELWIVRARWVYSWIVPAWGCGRIKDAQPCNCLLLYYIRRWMGCTYNTHFTRIDLENYRSCAHNGVRTSGHGSSGEHADNEHVTESLPAADIIYVSSDNVASEESMRGLYERWYTLYMRDGDPSDMEIGSPSSRRRRVLCTNWTRVARAETSSELVRGHDAIWVRQIIHQLLPPRDLTPRRDQAQPSPTQPKLPDNLPLNVDWRTVDDVLRLDGSPAQRRKKEHEQILDWGKMRRQNCLPVLDPIKWEKRSGRKYLSQGAVHPVPADDTQRQNRADADRY
jgi:hypothetical protein